MDDERHPQRPCLPGWRWTVANDIVIDTGREQILSGLRYTPAGAGRVIRYEVYASLTQEAWGRPVARGIFADDASTQTVGFRPQRARHVRLRALGGPGTATGEVGLLGEAPYAAAAALPPSPDAPRLSRTGWIATADSQETAGSDGRASNVLDGSTATIWHTVWSVAPAPPHPHRIVLDTARAQTVSGVAYLPRARRAPNGTIGAYEVHVSLDGANWGTAVASGTFPDTRAEKVVRFDEVSARYVRLTALSEAGNRGPWTSAAEITFFGRRRPWPTGRSAAAGGPCSASRSSPAAPR